MGDPELRFEVGDPPLPPRAPSTLADNKKQSMSERCEAFVPREVDHATQQTYERNGARVSLISKMMLALQESPAARDAALKEHLEEVQAKAQLRRLMGVLPVMDHDEGTKSTHYSTHVMTKASVRHALIHIRPCCCNDSLLTPHAPRVPFCWQLEIRPRFGSLAWMNGEYDGKGCR